MSLINTEQVMPAKPAQALTDPLFPAPDSALCSGHHIGPGELDNHVLLTGFQEYLEEFYARCGVRFTRALEGFFYLRPRSTMLIPRSVLSELDTMVGRILRYLYLSLERLASGGIFTQQGLYDKLLILADEAKLLKLVNNRSTGSDADRQKLQEKVCSSFNRLCRLDVVWFMGHDGSKSRITGLVFCSGVDVRAGDDPRKVQRRLVCDGEAVPIENHL